MPDNLPKGHKFFLSGLMPHSLYTKLIAIMLVMMLSFMTVVGAFLMRGIRNYYLNDFYAQMQNVFSDTGLVSDLRSAAGGENAPERMADILGAYSAQLGITSGTRDYFILSGKSGAYITGSDNTRATVIKTTPNILTAMGGSEGYDSGTSSEYIDVALPIQGESQGSYIVYIRDNRSDVQELGTELFGIIMSTMAVGLVISVFLGLLLARTMVIPVENLTHAAEKVAGGDFTDRLENVAIDEIGVLTRTFNDMADRLEKTLDDLRRSEQMRREFVANVSHELRTPITSVRSYAETLADSEDDIPAEVEKSFLRVIVTESDRMAKIVEDLLTLSRFDAGSIELNYEEFSFEKSLRDIYEAMLMETQKRSQAFSLTIESELPAIHGDRMRLEQVVMNMVSNAVKYTPDGGKIEIIAGAKPDGVWCTVKDTGIGIPPEDVGRVFERFYRVDKTRSRDSGGTGLGLSIAQETVSRHGGSLNISSRLGVGTEISLQLPLEGPENEI